MGFFSHFVAGDLILADKGFLIQNIVPAGVSVNIPPFLERGKLTKNEIITTKALLNAEFMWNEPMLGLKALNF